MSFFDKSQVKKRTRRKTKATAKKRARMMTTTTATRSEQPRYDSSVSATSAAYCSVLFCNASTSSADMNYEIPAKTSPPRKLPVILLIAPIAYGPTNPPRFPRELINAIPAAAENPAKNSLGSDKKGPNKL
jgi:hypothetical protein